MNPDTAKIIDRLVLSRDGLRKLNIADYAMIREAREAMSDAANALTNYAKTAVLIDQADHRVVEVLHWLETRSKVEENQIGYLDQAYDKAADALREAINPTALEAAAPHLYPASQIKEG